MQPRHMQPGSSRKRAHRLHAAVLAGFVAFIAAFLTGLVVFSAALFIVPNTAHNPGHIAALIAFPVLFASLLRIFLKQK